MSEGYQEASFGKRVQAIRERNGLTRATLGGLVVDVARGRGQSGPEAGGRSPVAGPPGLAI